VIVADYKAIIIASSVVSVVALIALICAFQFIRQVPRFRLFYNAITVHFIHYCNSTSDCLSIFLTVCQIFKLDVLFLSYAANTSLFQLLLKCDDHIQLYAVFGI